MTIQASGLSVWVVKHPSETIKNGIAIPDSALKKVHKGKIVSVGDKCTGSDIKKGRTAIFNKSAGFEITEDNIEYTIIYESDIVGTDD